MILNMVGVVRLFSVVIFSVLVSSILSQTVVQTTPNVPYHRSVQAGPYSQVQTAFGNLVTTIPLVNLKGIGNTSMGVNLQMNGNFEPNSALPFYYDSPGAGWSTDCLDLVVINGGSDPAGHAAFFHQVGSTVEDYWDYSLNSGQYSGITPYNGVHKTLSLEYSSGSVVGVILTDEKTLNRTYYEFSPASYTFWRSRTVDSFGNQVTYSYSKDSVGDYRISNITDASGRSIAFTYLSSSPYLLETVTLTSGTTTRTWSLVNSYQSGGIYFLGKIVFPQITSGGSSTTPSILFDYYGESLGENISDIYDLNQNHWGYNYAASSGLRFDGVVNPIAVKAVYPPLVASSGVYNPSKATAMADDTTNPITFTWGNYTDGSNVNLSLYACFIGTPYGNWSSNAGYLYSAHVYYAGWQNPSNPGNAVTYFVPIYQVVDPNVAADGQGSQSATGPYNGYHESYVWNLGDFTAATVTDRRGYVTSYGYYESGALANTGLPLTKTDPGGYQLKYFYNSSFRPIEVIDSTNVEIGGARSVYSYGPSNQALLQSVTNPATDPYGISPSGYGKYAPIGPLSISETYTYNGNGTVASDRVGADNPTRYNHYDSYGDVTSKTNPAGQVWLYTYDGFGNELTESPPSPAGLTKMAYDEWNRLVLITHADSSTLNYTYDLNANLIEVLDENGHFKNYLFDQLNRPYGSDREVDASSTDDILDSVTYDRDGNQDSVTNGRGNVTANSYDERGFLIKVSYPDEETRQFHYDGNGNRNKRIDGRNYETDYSFDPVNRPLATDYIHDSRTVTNVYNLDGTRKSMTDSKFSNHAWIWAYNGAKLISGSYQYAPNVTVDYTYQAGSGRKLTISAKSQTWTYGYDSAGRLSTVGQSIGDAIPVTYTYNADGDLAAKTFTTADWRTRYGYDSRRRLADVYEEQYSGDVWATKHSLLYARDYVGNMSACIRENSAEGHVTTTTNKYDDANRLTSEACNIANGWPGAMGYSNRYAFDKNDDRSAVTRGSSTTSYSIDANDKLASGDNFTLSAYDGDGNPASIKNVKTGVTMDITYDQQDEVVSITGLPTANSFAYDGDGHRVTKTDSKGTTNYVYDGDEVIMELGSTTTYRLPGVGEVSSNAGQLYQLDDQVGSTVGEVRLSSAFLGQYNYDGYGLEVDLGSRPAGSSNFRFVGRDDYLADGDTGFLLCGTRYYLPVLGRFLTQDPAGFAGGFDLYEYAGDSPHNLVEPTGFFAVPVAASGYVVLPSDGLAHVGVPALGRPVRF